MDCFDRILMIFCWKNCIEKYVTEFEGLDEHYYRYVCVCVYEVHVRYINWYFW